MVTGQSLGGASSAVAASAHAACARVRGTDPLIVGRTRRQLARDVGFADESGRIPEARWMRAMTFERLVRSTTFASEVATTTVGRLGLDRPTEVVTVNAGVSSEKTAALLDGAHARAALGAVTLIHGLAIPFVGFEDHGATEVKPDFAVVAPTIGGDVGESWLIVGDAKDYERVRSRIEDPRLLKGFLQVALGAESAAAWSRLPAGMALHSHGVLATPRNAFLQPEALVEALDDHRAEVRMRVAERHHEARNAEYDKAPSVAAFVAHLEATFDPGSCPTCTLFTYCRHRLRTSDDPVDLLVELGVSTVTRPQVVGLLDGSGDVSSAAPASVVDTVIASRDGFGRSTGQRRTDQAGQPGTVNVVVAKSDAATLGLHGVALQRVTTQGRGPWEVTVFDDPQSSETRRTVMRALGTALTTSMTEKRRADREPRPIHLVVPDASTADVLVSIADNLAGIELSRLRWERDREVGRPALTFNGEPAEVPPPLSESDRTAVSFLLEEDRARALTLRSPIVDVRDVLARHITAGGPPVASLRLDYLVRWGETERVDHRELADEIESSDHTPGARLANRRSDAVHQALAGTGRGRRSGDPPADPERYRALVVEELEYKGAVVERVLDVLAKFPDSGLREVHRAIEGDAQAVWRRRQSLHASDLVRFGRTYRHWRNSLVPVIESDGRCERQLLALANPQIARDLATDPGTREVALATVVSTSPPTLDVASRRIGDGSRIVLLHRGDEICVEDPTVEVKHQKGSFKFSGMAIGPLSAAGDPEHPRRVIWAPKTVPTLAVGDRLVVADFAWFGDLKANTHLPVDRPKPDAISAPKADCTCDSYTDDPATHRWCCRPHEDSEAEWSDELAGRRARGELNPEVWPPVVDGDAFEVPPAGAPQGDATVGPVDGSPDDVTMDDLE